MFFSYVLLFEDALPHVCLDRRVHERLPDHIARGISPMEFRNPRPQPQKFSKLVSQIYFS